MEKGGRYGELVVSIVIFLFFLNLFLFIESFMDLRVKRWTYVSPAIWPGWILAVGTVLAGFYVYYTYRNMRSEKAAQAAYAQEAEDEPAGEQPGQPAQEKKTVTLSVRELEEQAKAKMAKEEKSGPKELIRFITMIALTLVYLFLIRVLGFIISTALFGVLYLLLLQERRLWVLIVSPLAIIVFIWFVFTQVLAVPLPPGSGIFAEFSRVFY